MRIGVFDSGVGGLSVARAIEKALPEHEVLFRNDVEHLPYGVRPPEELAGYVTPILEGLVADGCRVIVIACNTVSTTLLDELRQKITVPLIGVEPMVKPAAAMTESKVIAVCATPTTLASKRYAQLKDEYAKDIQVVEPDCSGWTRMIEDDAVDHALISDQIGDALKLGADVVVLGCTHYHWIEEDIKRMTGKKAAVIQPTEAIIKRLKKELNEI